MKKTISLIKACMSSDMNIFKIKAKKDSKVSKLMLPIVLSFLIMFYMWVYANMILEKLEPLNLQFIALSLFVFVISMMTFVEGVYKSGNLLFNCKDDQLLLSLPIKKSTVLFIRIFKFYVFELIFNSLLFVPLVIAYLRWATVDYTFFITSFIMIFLLPIIPIVLSCIVGFITTSISSRSKFKNLVQIITTMIFLILVLYLSMNLNGFINNIAKHAKSINELITKIYYPAGVYANLAVSFNIKDLLIFIFVNIGLFILMILVLSKFYFKINSRIKGVITTNHKKSNNNTLIIKSRSQTSSLIKKEMSTFFNVPVFLINAGFGVLLFIIAVIAIMIKYNDIVTMFTSGEHPPITIEKLNSMLSVAVYWLILLSACTTSITSSMISLEGRSFNILKTLPVKTKRILMSKIYASMILTVPAYIIGSVLLFFKLNISIIDLIIILISCVLLPFISALIGIIINIKYPKLDAENATEVVKQSMSSMVSVFIGFSLIFINFLIFQFVSGLITNQTIILLLFLLLNAILVLILYIYLTKVSVKKFESITV